VNHKREAEVELAQGKKAPEVCKNLGVTEQTYYRWRKEYGQLVDDLLGRNRFLAITSSPVLGPARRDFTQRPDSIQGGRALETKGDSAAPATTLDRRQQEPRSAVRGIERTEGGINIKTFFCFADVF